MPLVLETIGQSMRPRTKAEHGLSAAGLGAYPDWPHHIAGSHLAPGKEIGEGASPTL
jgi:hypothetical protein